MTLIASFGLLIIRLLSNGWPFGGSSNQHSDRLRTAGSRWPCTAASAQSLSRLRVFPHSAQAQLEHLAADGRIDHAEPELEPEQLALGV